MPQSTVRQAIYEPPMDSLVNSSVLTMNGHSHTPTFEEPHTSSYKDASAEDWNFSNQLQSDSDETELTPGVAGGNWGKKNTKGARWIRRGKAAAWGPERGEWEVEERARKRLRRMMSHSRSPSPPTLSHLRESTVPLFAPYTPPAHEYPSYASFVLDPAMTHSFRTHVLRDLQQTTENLIQGEATLKRALGRLWKVLSEEEHVSNDADAVAKLEAAEADDELSERERRLARAPDLSLPMHKLFLTPFPNGGTTMVDPSQFGSPQMQLENMEKYLATLRELQDDSREYVERLEGIRECLGEVHRQRDLLWTRIREGALEELQEINQTEITVDGGAES